VIFEHPSPRNHVRHDERRVIPQRLIVRPPTAAKWSIGRMLSGTFLPSLDGRFPPVSSALLTIPVTS